MELSLNQYFTNEELEAFADALAQVGAINVCSAEDIGNAFRKINQCLAYDSVAETMNNLSERWAELAAPETPETTETSNENCSFDFLEQNAYDEYEKVFDEQDGWIIPLDTIRKI